MRRFLTIVVIVMTAGAGYAQQTWTALNGPFGGNISRIKVAPNGNIFVVSSQKLFRSTNAGDSWTEVVPTSPSSLFFNDIMIDADGKLYAALWSQLFVSADNGVTWTIVATNLFQNVQYITRVGPDNVFVVWGGSGVYVSINKGVSWTQITTLAWSGNPGLWANAAGDIFYGAQGDGLLRHTYRGLTTNWNSANMTQVFSVAPSSVNSMTIDNAGKIYVSAFDKIYTSTNGTTFTDITTTSGLAPSYTFFNGPMAAGPDGAVYIFNTGLGQLHKSTNAGASWTTTASPTANFGSFVNAVAFISASSYLLATSGEILKTTDNGATWLNRSSAIAAGSIENVVVANVTNRLIAPKGRGYWTSTDGGLTWTFVSLLNSVSKALKLANGNIILYGQGIFYRSIDNGANFTTDNVARSNNQTLVQASNGDLYSIYSIFQSPNWVLRLGRSQDNGATWTEQAITGLPTAVNAAGERLAVDGSNNFYTQLWDGVSSRVTFKITGTTATPLTVATQPANTFYNNIFFFENRLYVTQFSQYFVSSDGGTTWTTVAFSGDRVFPIKNATYSGIAVSRSGNLYISQNNGGEWSNTVLPSSSAYITDIATDASGDYYASSSGGPVYKFTNELLVDPATLPPFINFNWQNLNGPYGGVIGKVRVTADGNTLYAISSGRLWKSTAGTWARVDALGTTTNIFDFDLASNGDLYVLPSAAVLNTPQQVRRSTDGGVTWATLTSTGLPAQTGTNLTNVGNGFVRITVTTGASPSLILFGRDASLGRIYRSTDTGGTFSLVFSSAFNVLLGSGNTRIPAISPTNGTIALMSDPREGMLFSNNNGESWVVKSTASMVSNLESSPGVAAGFVGTFAFDNAGNLVAQSIFDTSATSWDVRISKSTNNGDTWVKLPAPSISTPFGSFYSSRIITLGTGEYLMCVQVLFDCYRSTDGGQTWTSIGNVGDVFVNAVSHGTNSYIIGSSNAGILRTHNGGQTFTPFSTGIPHPNSVALNLFNNKDLLVGATRPYYSSDFGQTFSLSTLEPAANFLQVGDSIVGYGSRRLLASRDGGKTWRPFGSDRQINFLTADAGGTGFYGATLFTLVFSTDLINWVNIPLSGLPANFQINNLVIDSGGVVFAVIFDPNTSTNKLYKIVFGSATDISNQVGTTNPVVLRYFGNRIYLYDSRGILYKTNDGDNWTQGSAPAGNGLFVSSGYLFVPSGTLGLWVSRNDGGSWQNVSDTPVAGLVQQFRNVVINEVDGYAYATVSNGVAKRSGNIVIPDDKTKPVALTFSPTNNATLVSLRPRLTITYDEFTTRVAGKILRVFDVAQPAVPVVTIDVANAIQNGKAWSVDIPSPLSFNKTYFVVLDAGAFSDLFGNTSNGIVTNTAWRFTTKNSPTIVTLLPANAATGVAANTQLRVTFSEAVTAAAGKNLLVFLATNIATPVASVSATSGTVAGNQVSYSLPSSLDLNATYFARFETQAFSTADGGVFSPLTQNTDWTFTVRAAPTASSLSPANAATGIATNTTLRVTFAEAVTPVAGKNFAVFLASNPANPVATLAATSAAAAGNQLSYSLPASLELNTAYFARFEAGAFTSADGAVFSALTQNTDWTFSTRALPTIATLSPANAATNIPVATTLAITFSENVTLDGTKKLFITDTAQPATPFQTLNLNTATTTGATTTFTLPSNLNFGTTYAVTFESGAFRSVDGAAFSVLTGSGWQFVTVPPPDVAPPSITFTADALIRGTAKLFSATITDNVGVTGSKIFFRTITSAANAKLDSANLQFQNGKWEVTVAENRFGTMGLEYFFTARDAANNVARNPATGFHYSYINFPAAAAPIIPGALVGVGGNVGDWRMISVPHTLSDARIATVFSELGAEDKTKWRLITFRSATAWDEFPQQFSSLQQGKGYFINARTLPAAGINIDGATSPAYNRSNPFKLTLSPGWNQIGNPYTFKIVWSEVLAFNNNPAGIGASLKRYTGNYVDATDLEVFEGAFVFNSGTSAVTLNVPVTGTNSGGRTSDWRSNAPGGAWLLPISVSSDAHVNNFGGVGMHPGASASIDDFDDFSPPAIGTDMQIRFDHPEHFSGGTTRDVVPTAPEFVWEFTLLAEGKETVRLEWNSDFGPTSEVVLVDHDRGVVVDMQSKNSLVVNPRVSRNFVIYYGKDAHRKVMAKKHTLGTAFPNPTVDRVSIPFGLSDYQSGYSVRIEVFDGMGRRVKTLAEGTFAPGFYETFWNHLAEGVSPGLYTYRMVVNGIEAEVLTGKMMIQR